jgi:hypothetical protein
MHGISVVDVSDLMRLAFLAPEMVDELWQAVNRAHDASFTDPTF